MLCVSEIKFSRVVDRIVGRHASGFFVSMPASYRQVPVECPVCDMMLKTSDDALSMSTDDCCFSCQQTWVESRRSAWKSGWRPTQEELDTRMAVCST